MAGATSIKTVPKVQSQPRTKGARTRERLLDLAQDAVIRKGFGATSIEELVEAAGITKSGFFYHFKDKTDLGRQMVERYAEHNKRFLAEMEGRARELSDDPLHSFLIFLKFYAESMEGAATSHPGCMVATVTFQDLIWDGETRRITVDGVKDWRGRFLAWLEEIAAAYPPPIRRIDLADLADSLLAITYGGMTLAKALEDKSAIARQTLMYRETVRLYFLGT